MLLISWVSKTYSVAAIRFVDVRFFLFLLAALEVLEGADSWDTEAAILELGLACDAGAGVAEERPALADTGVSGTFVSESAVGKVNDWLAWMAVVRIAFINKVLFCLFFAPFGVTRAFFLVGISVNNASDACGVEDSPSASRFFSSAGTASFIGQTNPVLGVYAGRCWRNMSSELCKECKEVS